MCLGFPELTDVSERTNIADLFLSSKRRIGIYLLRFPDGDYYVGQTNDVVRRFSQHLHDKGPITEFSFFPARKKDLDCLEQDCISRLEHKCNLKNISLITYPQIETDFDGLMDREEQSTWLDYEGAVPRHFSRNRDKNYWKQLERRYADRFSHLMEDPYFKQYFLPVMQKYVKYCIPEPFLTEMSFWSCSCLPYFGRKSDILIRMNLRSCEVLTVGYNRDPVIFYYDFHACKSVLSPRETKQLKKQFSTLSFFDHQYESAGQDQCAFRFQNFNEVMEALDHPVCLKAIKTFNLGQMRKGATLYHQFHCVALAKLLLSGK